MNALAEMIGKCFFNTLKPNPTKIKKIFVERRNCKANMGIALAIPYSAEQMTTKKGE